MAARELIEDENVLSLEKIKKLFNHFFRDNSKIINVATVEKWILHPKSKSRMFGITPTRYRALNSSQKGHAKKPALDKFQSVFEEIFQRRHDCIHNCDRPKSALQGITPTSSKKCIENVVFLVSRSEEAIVAEFPEYLGVLGFSGAVRNQVCG